MKSNVYVVESAANKKPDVALRFSFSARVIILALAILAALLALLAAAMVVRIVGKLNVLLAQTLWITAAQKGQAFGEVTGTLATAAILGALSWTLFRLSSRTKPIGMATQSSMRMPRFRKLTFVALGILTFAFAVLVISFAIEAGLGAIALTSAAGNTLDRSLLKLGYIHELHFWLPLGSLMVCLATAIACNFIRLRIGN